MDRILLVAGKKYSFSNDSSEMSLEILKCIGRGGNSVVYEILCDGNEIGILKELYPRDMSINRDDKGNLIIEEKYELDFEKRKEDFKHILIKRNELFRQSKDIAATMPEYCQIFEGRNTLYFFQSKTVGNCYSEIRGETLEEIIHAAIALTRTLKAYHDIRYVHLDVKPENMLVINQNGQYKVQLFDFETVCSIDDIKNNRIKFLPFTEHYSSPEQKERDKYNNIDIRSDIFSVGIILFERIMGRYPSEERFELSKGSKYDYNFQFGPLKNKPLIVQNFLNKLFEHTIRSNMCLRAENDDLLIEILKEILNLCSEKNEIIPNNKYVSHLPLFNGRDYELLALDDSLLEGSVVLVYGIIGIGKTELVRKYLTENSEKYYRIVYIEETGDSIRDAIISDNNLQIDGLYRQVEHSEAEYFEIKLQAISKQCQYARSKAKEIIVVFDGIRFFDDLTYLFKLRDAGCKIIMVSRDSWEDVDIFDCKLEIGRMKCEDAEEQLFLNYINRKKDEINYNEKMAMKEIINKYEGHPLLLMIIAKALNHSSFYSISEMLAELDNSGIGAIGNEKIRFIDKDIIKSKKIEEILFEIWKFNNYTPNEIEVIKFMTLVPAGGIHRYEMNRIIDNNEFLDKLVSDGFISCSDNSLTIHPIVREMVQEKYPITNIEARYFADRVLTVIINSVTEIEKRRVFLYAHIAIKIERIAGITNTEFYKVLANMCSRIGEYDASKQFYEKYISMIENRQENNKLEIAKAYGMYGRALRVMGNYNECRNALETASIVYNECINESLVEDEAELLLEYAHVDSQLALLYRDNGEVSKALELNTNAYEIAQKYINKSDKAKVYLIYFAEAEGGIFFEQGQYEKALEFYEKSMSINEGKSVYTLCGMARCKYMLRKYVEAEEYIRKAISYIEKLKGCDSIEAAKVYYYAAKIFQKLDNYNDASIYFDQALRIEEALLGKNHNYTLMVKVDYVYFKSIFNIEKITIDSYNELKNILLKKKKSSNTTSFKSMYRKMGYLANILGVEDCWN